MNICVVHPTGAPNTETFIRAHIDRLPGKVLELVSTGAPPGSGLIARKLSGLKRRIGWRDLAAERSFASYLRERSVDLVLAEFGTTAVFMMASCRMTGLPLVPVFHGFDAYKIDILERYIKDYRQLFEMCPAIVGVSSAMLRQLESLGAPRSNLYQATYGVDTIFFPATSAAENPPHFVGVGRFVEKKAPHLTLRAFKRAIRECPEVSLTMAGSGPLRSGCRAWVKNEGLEKAVRFPGDLRPRQVADLMRRSRAFVQHSIRAPDGDSEGTPVAVLEAGSSGLPVIGTRHAGIPEVVVEDETGLLVDEQDIEGMAKHMITLAREPQTAARLGAKAAERIRRDHNIDDTIRHLAEILHKTLLPRR